MQYQKNANVFVQLLENRDKANDKRIFFLFVDEDIEYISNIFSYIETSEILKYQQKESKSGCGIGQKNAKDKRIKMLIELIKNSTDDFNKDLHIDQATYYKMLSSTFKGLEDYPRSPVTLRTYKEDIERELGKKIKLIRKVSL